MSRQYACGTGISSLIRAADILDLGLDKVGSACAVEWTGKDVDAFERGLDECKRDFAQIASDYLPHKGCHLVGDFYYNVWKTKGIPQAKAWYRRRDEVSQSHCRDAACDGYFQHLLSDSAPFCLLVVDAQ